MYQTGASIKGTLDALARHDLVLPAIQREFVWQPEQICRLFDSLMQGYPIGTFLFWRVNRECSGNFTYYDFVSNYHEQRNPYGERLPSMPNRSLTAVLDGQQRLTSLNIGFRGSMAWKLARKWRSSAGAYPVRHLYMDVLWQSHDDGGEGQRYRFEFLTRERADAANENECWFPVSKVLSMDAGPDLIMWLNERLHQNQVADAYKKTWRLHQITHSDTTIAFYEEKSQELDKVLQIFIRMNSGGTVLSYSDLLLSIAVAQWAEFDAREEIRTLVRDLNDIGGGFSFSKDFVLKAGLMLSDIGSVGFKVDNFNRENMAILENNWNRVKNSLIVTVELVSWFGFNGHTLRADSALLPIAYYIHVRGHDQNYLTRREFQDDRKNIRHWLTRSILKASGIWGSGLDTLLSALREVIRNSEGLFPAIGCREEMARRGRSLAFEREEIEDLSDIKYGDARTFALLTLIFEFVDLERHRFHIDHVVPRARFKRSALRQADIPYEKHDEFIDRSDRLANLQLLQGLENTVKSDKMPGEWLLQEKPDKNDRDRYADLHMLGNIPEKMADFLSFFDARRAALQDRIANLLGTRLGVEQDAENSA